MPRFITLLCLTLVGCQPTADQAPTIEPRTSDTLVERAIEVDATFHEAPPTMPAAEDHALRLAELSRAASSAPPGTRHPYGVRRLAMAADLVRNELLACRAPLWELRNPPASASVSTSAWLHAHQRALRDGISEGWTTNARAVHAMLTVIDERLASPRDRDTELYMSPPLREHREFLLAEVQPHARAEIGLAHLPFGRRCFDARARLLAGHAFDETDLRRSANAVLARPQVFDDVDLTTHPALHEPGGLHPIWRPSPAIARGAQLVRHTRNDRRRNAIVAAVAAGALIDLALHAEADVEAVDRLAAKLPWIPGPVFAHLVQRSAVEPLLWLSTFEGYRRLERLRGTRDAARFDQDIERIGALEPELLAIELGAR